MYKMSWNDFRMFDNNAATIRANIGFKYFAHDETGDGKPYINEIERDKGEWPIRIGDKVYIDTQVYDKNYKPISYLDEPYKLPEGTPIWCFTKMELVDSVFIEDKEPEQFSYRKDEYRFIFREIDKDDPEKDGRYWIMFHNHGWAKWIYLNMIDGEPTEENIEAAIKDGFEKEKFFKPLEWHNSLMYVPLINTKGMQGLYERSVKAAHVNPTYGAAVARFPDPDEPYVEPEVGTGAVCAGIIWGFIPSSGQGFVYFIMMLFFVGVFSLFYTRWPLIIMTVLIYWYKNASLKTAKWKWL